MILLLQLFAVLAFLSSACSTVYLNPYQINLTEYYAMPDLFQYDDYDKCLALSDPKQPPAYCVVNTFVKPDEASHLYNFVHEFSGKEKQHFRHDKLERGVCMRDCLQLIDELGDEAENYFTENFPTDSKLTFDFVNFTSVNEDRLEFNRVVNICINKHLRDNFNLTGFSSISHCLSSNRRIPIDWLDYSLICVICLWLAMVIASSLIDKRKSSTTDHYLKPFEKTSEQLLTSFSIKRNWYRLISESKPEYRDLRCINGMKAVVMFLITNGHVFWFLMSTPMKNPLFIEQQYHELVAMVMINGENLPNTFFFFSGFLFYVLAFPLLQQEVNRSTSFFVKAVIYRYVRLMPLMTFFLWLDSTWLYRLGSGPIWEKVNFAERQFCRKNWWTNLLMINNYVSGDEKCLVHSWFLSTDLQISTVGLLLLIVIAKRPTLRKIVLSSALLVSFCTVVVHVYVNRMAPIFLIIPEFLRNQLMVSSDIEISYFYKFHSPSHINMGNYIVGLIFGVIYLEAKVKLVKVRNSPILKTLWHLSWISGYVISMLGFPFVESNVEPSIWTAIYGGFVKHYHGFLLGALTIGVAVRCINFVPKILNLPAFRVMGRVCYSYYLSHLLVMRLFMTVGSQPHEISITNAWIFTGAIFFFGNLLAIPFALVVEFPINAIAKEILKKFEHKDESVDCNGNDLYLKRVETND